MSAFKAYDIRGIFGKDFNLEDVYRIGFYLPELLNTTKVLVGRDARETSPAIFGELANGINAAGADVYDLGLCTTPLVYWATARFGFDASVMITASHNPAIYNGLKISRSMAMPVGYDTGLQALESRIAKPPQPTKTKGKIIPFGQAEIYLQFLNAPAYNTGKLKLVIDCGNGMAGLFARKLFGNQPVYLYEEPDGTFPNHEPNPLDEKNLEVLKKTVLSSGADLGVVFDGDADRVMFVDENARFIPPDLMIAVLAHNFLKDGRLSGRVLQDIRTSLSVTNYIEALGGEMHIWRVGRAFAAPKLQKIDGLFGGELAGHYYFSDFYYSDSGLLAALRILEVFARFKEDGLKVSEVIARIEKFHNSGEINFRIAAKDAAMKQLSDDFCSIEKPVKVYDFDGIRMEFPGWWFNVRPSNTEPYLRFIAEADTSEKLAEIISRTRHILKAFE
jgi:phosphomannomutase